MSQHDGVIDNQSFPQFRADLNNCIESIFTNHSGATAPASTYANMWWVDSANNLWKQRNSTDGAWIVRSTIDEDGCVNQYAGNPEGVLSSNYDKELIHDTTNGQLFQATGSGVQTYRAFSKKSVRTITENSNLKVSDGTILCNSASDITLTLGSPTGVLLFSVINIGTGKVTLSGTVGGVSNPVLWPGNTEEIIFDGSNFRFLKEQGKGRVLIDEQIAVSSNNLIFNKGFSDEFTKYEFDILNIRPNTDAALLSRVSSDNGSSFISTNLYEHAGFGVFAAGISSFTVGQSAARNNAWTFCSAVSGQTIESSDPEGLSATMTLYTPWNNATAKCKYTMLGHYRNSGSQSNASFFSCGSYWGNNAVNAVLFYPGSGALTSGSIRMYGVY